MGTEEFASLRLLQLEGAGYGMFCQEHSKFLTENDGETGRVSLGSWSMRWDLTAGGTQAVENK